MALLGGQCSVCGWVPEHPWEIAAFHFHHKDPSKKEYGIGKVAQKSWTVIVKEVKKCSLMCSRCHTIHHATAYRDPKFIAELERYQGKETFSNRGFDHHLPRGNNRRSA